MRWFLILVAAFGLAACSQPSQPEGDELSLAPDIAERRAKFAPQVLKAEVSHLEEGDREALRHLVEAARAMDEIFHIQAWAGNESFAPRVAALAGPDADSAREYYRIMYGPWDRLEDFEPFLGDAPHPRGAGYYPEDLDEAELEAWLEAHPEDREALTSLFTIVRRDGDALVAVPYSVVFEELLEKAAVELRAAAAATPNESLKRFLELRADAFFSDDYYESDLAWMDLDSAIEVVIGPYETYEDGLFGYKAAFESFVCVAQPEDSQKLAMFKQELPFLERNLPIPDEHKNLERGTSSPIRVVDEVFTGGDTRAGVQTLAFNLPNDERVREAKGSKKVLLKNVMRAKFDAILTPIAGRVLPGGDIDKLDFDAYFNFILFHEMSHGLGPGLIEVDGRATEVRLELKELYSAIEEAKADVLGVHDLYALAERDLVPTELIEALPWTYVAGLFRSARFGVTEAHGLGVVLQTSFLISRGAVEVTEEGRFRPVPELFPAAIEELAHEILMVQAVGSYEGAHAMVEEFGQVPPAMAEVLAGLGDIPVDIDPVYPLEGL